MAGRKSWLRGSIRGPKRIRFARLWLVHYVHDSLPEDRFLMRSAFWPENSSRPLIDGERRLAAVTASSRPWARRRAKGTKRWRNSTAPFLRLLRFFAAVPDSHCPKIGLRNRQGERDSAESPLFPCAHCRFAPREILASGPLLRSSSCWWSSRSSGFSWRSFCQSRA